jgi:prepilin signal peptidase PulO-like enzyme (type II secretory pathway)
MKKRVSRISILQSAKMATAMYALLGFLYTLIGIPLLLFGSQQMKVMAILYLCMPILMAVFGFIFFVISAAIYNLVARWLGGFEFEVTDVP